MAFNKLSLEEKLLSKTIQQGECLVWTGHKSDRGYGLLRISGKHQRAHRLMYQLRFGPISEGLVVRHSCDNPLCININHLHLGSQADNVNDMIERGRANKSSGAKHPRAKLTSSQVEEIRRRYVPGVYGKGAHAIAKEFGVSKPTVRSILLGETWKLP